jgi:hypothetical protein
VTYERTVDPLAVGEPDRPAYGWCALEQPTVLTTHRPPARRNDETDIEAAVIAAALGAFAGVRFR